MLDYESLCKKIDNLDKKIDWCERTLEFLIEREKKRNDRVISHYFDSEHKVTTYD
jgi:hypothetical protein